MSKEYYVLEGEEKNGPFTYNQLIEKGIDIYTQVAPTNTNEWQYATELPEFTEYFEARGIYFPTGDNLANFGWRALAFVIDYFILCVPIEFILIQTGLIVLPATPSFTLPSPHEMFILQIAFFATFLVYNAILESSKLKGSLGKKICKLIVVDVDGQKLSILKTAGRNAGALASLALYGIPFFTILFSQYKQTWYDNLAKAYVIKTN